MGARQGFGEPHLRAGTAGPQGPGNSLGRRAPPRTPPAGLPWGIAGPPKGPAGDSDGPLGLTFRWGSGEIGLHAVCLHWGMCSESGGLLGLEASDFLGPLEPNPGALGTQQSERGQAPSLVTAWACRPFRCWFPEPGEPSGGHSIQACGPS